MLNDLLNGNYMNYEINVYKQNPSDELYKTLVKAYGKKFTLYYSGYALIIKTLTWANPDDQVLYFTETDFETAVVPVILTSLLKMDTSERLTFEPGTDWTDCAAKLIVWGHIQSDAAIADACTRIFKQGWFKDIQSYKMIIADVQNARNINITDTLYYPEVSTRIHRFDICIGSDLGDDTYILLISDENIQSFRDQLEAAVPTHVRYAYLHIPSY